MAIQSFDIQSFGTSEDADRLARFAHGKQRDKAGKPYVEHVMRVADKVRRRGGSADAVIAATLHDVVEDTVLSTQMLLDLGFSARAVEIVEMLTRTPDVSEADYYARIAADDEALMVKEADIDDNLDPERTAALDPETRQRLLDKYSAAKAALGLAGF